MSCFAERPKISHGTRKFIPYFGFFNGIDRLVTSELSCDINQLLRQLKYNFQVQRSLVELTEDTNVHIADNSSERFE